MVGDIVLDEARVIQQTFALERPDQRLDDAGFEPFVEELRAQLATRVVAPRQHRDRVLPRQDCICRIERRLQPAASP
jgi:hypothetical protein